jgi:hypothetical protein
MEYPGDSASLAPFHSEKQKAGTPWCGFRPFCERNSKRVSGGGGRDLFWRGLPSARPEWLDL